MMHSEHSQKNTLEHGVDLRNAAEQRAESILGAPRMRCARYNTEKRLLQLEQLQLKVT